MEKTPPRVVCYKNFISSRGLLTGGAKKKKKKTRYILLHSSFQFQVKKKGKARGFSWENKDPD